MDSMQSDRLKSFAPRWALDAADVTTRMLALATATDRPFPDFLVIGAKRGGTTSLFNYLVRHPGILGLYPQARGKKSTDYYFANNDQTERWYRSHFHSNVYRKFLSTRLGYTALSFEASPYYVWDPRIAEKVAGRSPQTKAILLLRDPVKRAWSHYQERVQNGVEPLKFSEALEREDERLDGELDRMLSDPHYHSTAWDWYSYKSRGEYLWQIENWTRHLPRENLLVLFSETLYVDTQTTVDKICNFLSLPRFALPTTRTYNASQQTQERIGEREEENLGKYFQAHNQELAQYLELDVPWFDKSG